MKRKSNSTTSGPAASNSAITSPELQIIENNILNTTDMNNQQSSTSSSNVEHKETYVNMIYPSTAASCSTEIPTGTISPIEDDDDVEMVKKGTKKSSLGPFHLRQLGIMRSGSFKLKSISPPPCELTSSPDESKINSFDRQKSSSVTNAPPRPSRLKKFFLLSRADPSRKQQKDVSLKNLKHVLWQNVSLVLWPAIGNLELLTSEIRGQKRLIASSNDTLETGMKTIETQTELLDGISPCSDTPPTDFQVVNETINQSKLNLSNMTDLRCIDESDLSSGRRILFPLDNPETKL
jgi:hypothetical protein